MHIQTPLIPSLALSSIAKRPVFLKLEAVQLSGSFKVRGIGYLCQKLAHNNIRHFVNSSGGNAGLAVAYAAQKLNIKATIVVSNSTPERTRNRLIEQGKKFGNRESLVNVLVHGSEWKEADQLAQKIAKQDPESEYISPFDHPDIWDGHASLIDELIDDPILEGQIPSEIMLSVGGGGLLLGVLKGLERGIWRDKNIRVVACETEGAASFSASFQAKQIVDIGKITSIAGSLAAPRVSDACLPWILNAHSNTGISVCSQVVSDIQAVESCKRFADDHRILVETACGAALAPIYYNLHKSNNQPIVIIVCGGNSVDRSLFTHK